MSTWAKLNGVLLVLVIGVFALNWALEADLTQRNVEVLPGMVQSVAYESYTDNSVLAGGVTLQTPPPGTIPSPLVCARICSAAPKPTVWWAPARSR